MTLAVFIVWLKMLKRILKKSDLSADLKILHLKNWTS